MSEGAFGGSVAFYFLVDSGRIFSDICFVDCVVIMTCRAEQHYGDI